MMQNGRIRGVAGLWAFTSGLRWVQWPQKFRPMMRPRYDGVAELEEFLWVYMQAI